METRESGRAGFWRRQFAEPQTKGQIAFDILFGLGVPLVLMTPPLRELFDFAICVAFESLINSHELSFVRGFYVYAVLEMAVLLVAMAGFPRGRPAARIAGGFLILGAATCAYMAVLPGTPGAAIFLMGALDPVVSAGSDLSSWSKSLFVLSIAFLNVPGPVGCGFAFLRNGVRTIRRARSAPAVVNRQ